MLQLLLVLNLLSFQAAFSAEHIYEFTDLLWKSGIKICVVGDTGTGTQEQAQVAHALEQEGCHQIRILGDLIYPDGIESSSDPLLTSNFKAPYASLLERSDGPQFFLMFGNHDYKGKTKAWASLHRGNKEKGAVFLPHRYYAERYPDICFLTLDTTPYDSLRHFLKTFGQGTWARRARKALAPRCKFSIALAHHPYASSGHHGNARAFLKAFLKNQVIGKVDLFIAGHEHMLSDEGVRQGTTQLISGAGGQLRAAPALLPTSRFVAAELGYVTLTFAKSRSGTVTGHYEFRKAYRDGTAVTLHSGTLAGQGIR